MLSPVPQDSARSVPRNDIDMAGLATCPSNARLRQITRALGILPAPLTDLVAYNHPISHAFGHYQKALSEKHSGFWLVIGLVVFLWPGVVIAALVVGGLGVALFKATLAQRLVVLLWTVVVAAVLWAYNRRPRVAVRPPLGSTPRPSPLTRVVPVIENADVVIRGPGFLLVNCGSRDRLRRIGEWLDAWPAEATQGDVGALYTTARNAVATALQDVETQISESVRSERRAVFPISSESLAAVDEALQHLDNAANYEPSRWPAPPIRVRPLVPVAAGQRRALGGFAKPIAQLDFSHPDLLHSRRRNYRATLQRQGVPTDLAYRQFPDALQSLLAKNQDFQPTLWTAVLSAVGMLAPLATVVPVVSWQTAEVLLWAYPPIALLLLAAVFMVQSTRQRFPTAHERARRAAATSNCSSLAQMTFVLNGHHHVAVADGLRPQLDETSAWAQRVATTHATESTVVGPANALLALITELMNAHAEQVDKAIATAPHGTVIVPVTADKLDGPAGDLYLQLGVFQLDMCSPPQWLTTTLG